MLTGFPDEQLELELDKKKKAKKKRKPVYRKIGTVKVSNILRTVTKKGKQSRKASGAVRITVPKAIAEELGLFSGQTLTMKKAKGRKEIRVVPSKCV